MHRPHWHVGHLRWRLTRSYVLVTLVIALAFEFALTQSSATRQSQLIARRPLYARTLIQLEAPQLVPLLAQPASSRAAIYAWVATFQKESIRYSASPTDLTLDTSLLVRVLAPNGQVLASAVDSSQSPTETQRFIATVQAHAVIQAALTGDTNPGDLVHASPTGQTVIAVPILAADKRVLGVLVDVQRAPNQFGPLDLVLLTAFFALAATLVGTAFGWLASRGITRRLSRLAQAAHAWSHGEFQVEVRDRSPDELGQLARDLNRMAEQLRTLFSTRQELATVEERHRLARDLHDSVKQDVFAAALLVGAARTLLHDDQGQVRAYLTEAEGLAEQARQELTALIHELRPVALEGTGLAHALEEYARRWSLRTGIRVELQVASASAVPVEGGAALFRVAQEALANVARHSAADQVWVQLDSDDGEAQLQIRDNGKGFDVTRVPSAGVGLSSMRERAAAHQGAVEIASSSGGTLVRATIPLGSAVPIPSQEVGV